MKRCLIVVTLCLSVACAGKHFAVAPQAKNHPNSDWEPGSEEEEELDPSVPLYLPLAGATPAELEALRFAGVYREKAKTSVVSGSARVFPSVRALREWLPEDPDMRDDDPAIGKITDRVDVERHNVRVTAWVYAAKFEDDHDFHVIIGTRPGSGTTQYFNVEISGLPKSSSAPATAKLRKARKQFLTLFADELPTKSDFKEYDPPLAVVVEGALYYDRGHAPKAGGPGWAKPNTSWEIHPVTKITPQ